MFGGVYEYLSTSVLSLPRVFYTMCRPSLPVLLWDFPSRPFILQAQINNRLRRVVKLQLPRSFPHLCYS